MGIERWEIKILSPAKEQMREIKDRRIQASLATTLRRLEYAPDQQGKPLMDELVGYHSVRAVSQRYRIIYHLRADLHIVFIIGMGIRKEGDKKDIYAQAKKVLRRGLFNLNIEIENIINAREEVSPPTVIPIESATGILPDEEHIPASPHNVSDLENL